ncbi:MAG: M56 family metallopeptidase [Vicinamibacterales bacterium]
MILLVTWLWQGLVVAWATGLLLGCARTISAATRHVVWWLSLVAVLILPAANAVAIGSIRGSSTSLAVTPAVDAALPLPAAPDWLLAAAAGAWIIVAGLGCLRMALSVRAVFRLKSVSGPLEPARAAMLPCWNAARHTGRRPSLRVSDHANGACALGLGQPVILVSRSLVGALNDRELDDIVMHERAHLERYDDWTQLAQASIAAIAGLHPAVWFIGRRIQFDREAACDDPVVTRTGAVRAYARSLVEAAAACAPGGGAAGLAIPGATRSRSALDGRVRRLLDPVRDRAGTPTLRAAIVSVAGLMTAVGVGAGVPSVVVFVETTMERPQMVALTRIAAGLPRLRPTVPPASTDVSVASLLANGRRIEPGSAGPDVVAPLPEPGAPAPSEQAEPVFPLAPIPVATRLPADAFGSGLATDTPQLSEDMPGSPSASPAPWSAVARSAASAGDGVARAGTTTGARARDAGVSIGRLFGRAGKAIAGGF